MNRRLLAVIVAAVFLRVSDASATVVQDVVDQVSSASYRAYLGYPGDGGNPLFTHAGDLDRRWSANHDLARSNIVSHFTSLGLATTLEPFSYSGGTYYNVVAVLPGAVRPNDIYVIGAHFDTVETPGADDNASGVAGIMEAARVLCRFDFEATIQFVAFDREEQDLVGSSAFATAAKNRGDRILGMISLDMIAYNNNGSNTADIYGRSSSDALKMQLASAVATYGGLSATLNGPFDASDHAPFEWNGYQAALLIEDWGNPYYHTAADNVDTPSYLDYTFATNMTRGVVGYVADAAVLVPEPGTSWLIILGVAIVGRSRRRGR